MGRAKKHGSRAAAIAPWFCRRLPYCGRQFGLAHLKKHGSSSTLFNHSTNADSALLYGCKNFIT